MQESTKLRDMSGFEGWSFQDVLKASFDPALWRADGEGPTECLQVAQIETPLETMVAVADDRALHVLEFLDRRIFGAQMEAVAQATKRRFHVCENAVTAQVRAEITGYFQGHIRTFKTPLALHGTDFVQAVWRALQDVPAGETRSYGALARAMNHPKAVRAVAQANGANRLAVIVPCHRIIGADGSLTGYGGGLWRKRWLLDHEARHFGHGLL